MLAPRWAMRTAESCTIVDSSARQPIRQLVVNSMCRLTSSPLSSLMTNLFGSFGLLLDVVGSKERL